MNELAGAGNIVELTVENFQHIILEVSNQKLVMIDFWADWCQPCKDLMPILEKLAREYGDALVLAKVNCDEQQEIAAQFGVRNLPTVMLVQGAQPVDGFAGVQPESQIREMLAKYLPQPEDEFVQQAQAFVAEGNYQEAFPVARQAYVLAPDNIDVKYLYIDCLIETGSIPAAKTELESITLVDQDSRYHSLVSKLELIEQAAESPELKQLQAALEAEPDNLQVRVDLAVQLQQAHKVEEALEMLLSVLKKDLNFGDAKKTMLDMINALPDGEPLKSGFRRKVYSLLY